MEVNVMGRASRLVRPDEVKLVLSFSFKRDTYEEAFEIGQKAVVDFEKNILLPNSFEINDLKTTNLLLREEKVHQDNKFVFDGYSYLQEAELSFPYDMDRLFKIIREISMLENPPIFHLNFSLSDEQKYRNEVLVLAFQDAEEKANVLAGAAGKELKDCLKVDFQPIGNTYLSPTRLDSSIFRASMAEAAVVQTFTPADIEIQEIVYAQWLAE